MDLIFSQLLSVIIIMWHNVIFPRFCTNITTLILCACRTRFLIKRLCCTRASFIHRSRQDPLSTDAAVSSAVRREVPLASLALVGSNTAVKSCWQYYSLVISFPQLSFVKINNDFEIRQPNTLNKMFISLY